MIFFLFSSVLINAQPFGPPIYVADPVSLNCKYYFAGDPDHINPRPENYTINVGYTTFFKSDQHACEFFRCAFTNGTVLVNDDDEPLEHDLCVCPENTLWNNVSGCINVKQEQVQRTSFLQSFWNWIKGLFS